jgi:hypothetical protein
VSLEARKGPICAAFSGLCPYKVLLHRVVGSQDLIRTSDMTRRDAVNSIRPRALAETNGAQFLPLLRHFMPLEELGNFEKPRGEGRDKFILSETGRPVIDRSGGNVLGNRLV